MVLATLSWIDVVIVLMLITSIAYGFRQGLLRQVFLLLAMYLATVLAAQYYKDLGALIRTQFPTSSEEMSGVIAFIMVGVTSTLLLTWLLWQAYRQTKLPSVMMLDEMGGTVVGVVIGIFFINLTLTLVHFALQSAWAGGGSFQEMLHDGMVRSILQAAFRAPLPVIQFVLRPWLPDGLPGVLAG